MMDGLSAWQSVWVDQHTTQSEMHAFRMVETQHIAATMRLVDSAGLVRTSVSTELSMVEAKVSGVAVDLMSPPWSLAQAVWQHPQDYTQTQRLGALVRERGGVSWIRYGSVRAPGHVCAAVIDPDSLSMITPQGPYEQWHCQVVSDKVTLSNGSVRYDFI